MHSCFVGMQPQPDALQPLGQRRPDFPGLALSHAVHHCIVGIALGVHTATTFAMATEIGTSRASDERLMFTVSA